MYLICECYKKARAELNLVAKGKMNFYVISTKLSGTIMYGIPLGQKGSS